MASPDVLDFAKLLAPIPGDKPAGADLRADTSPTSTYYATKDARNKARADERKMVAGDEADVPPPDWKPVVQHATKALAEKSKDLELTAYLIEALARTHGFAGLRDGFRLARELAEKYWETIYPLPDEEGLETRVAGLTGLNGQDAEGTLKAPIAKIPITESKGEPPFAAYHYEEALNFAKVTDPKVRERKLEQGTASLEKIQQAVNESSGKFYMNLVEDIDRCCEEYGKLTAVLDAKCGEKAPPSSNIRAALAAVLDVVKNVAKHKLEAPAAPKEEKKDGAPAAGGQPQKSSDQLQSRDEAFNLLLKVAEFFRRTEPHTPVPYAIEQAVRWGRMPLPELLAELVPEESPRKALFKQVGIKLAEAKDEKKK
ncbi:MAG: type VI secretion system protein TssA [Gemmataceae bacterium]